MVQIRNIDTPRKEARQIINSAPVVSNERVDNGSDHRVLEVLRTQLHCCSNVVARKRICTRQWNKQSQRKQTFFRLQQEPATMHLQLGIERSKVDGTRVISNGFLHISEHWL